MQLKNKIEDDNQRLFKVGDNLLDVGTCLDIEAGKRLIQQQNLRFHGQDRAQHLGRLVEAVEFFGELVEFMTSAPVVVQVLEGEDAVAKNREVMGATNPAEAAEGTIRKEFALSIGENSAHGSDSDENAAIEMVYFFAGIELVG